MLWSVLRANSTLYESEGRTFESFRARQFFRRVTEIVAALQSSPLKIGAIVLAAGRSTRMGANKLTADFGGRPLIARPVDVLADAGLPEPIVVFGHTADDVRTALGNRPLRFVIADRFAEGMGHSLAAGVAAVPGDWDAVLVCLGDMPLLTVPLIQALVVDASREAIVAPVHKGRRGHPVLWGRRFFRELTKLRGDTGARALIDVNAKSLREVEWANGEEIFLDIDNKSALDVARSRLLK
jgi:molybdenum cofactor cytidylyltransferase